YHNIQFDINNSEFENNKGLNGGVMYFGKEKNENENENNKHELNIKNTNFINNKSKYFGGVIYSKYKNLHSLIASNTKFINNYAGVAGGALFSPNYPQYYLFDYNNCEFMDNKAESHGNDYATNPSLIKLLNDDKYHDYKMKSGSYLPISFLIYDSYENIIHDHYHYYSDIYIKVLVEKINYNSKGKSNDNDNNYGEISILKGNIGSFVNVFKVESLLEEEILFNKDFIDVKIEACDKDQYNVYDSNNILICENPICPNSCPTNSTAKCIISDNNTYGKNDIKNNKCQCNDGWTGELCDVKVFVDFSQLGIKIIKNNKSFISLPPSLLDVNNNSYTSLKMSSTILLNKNSLFENSELTLDKNGDFNYIIKILKNIRSSYIEGLFIYVLSEFINILVVIFNQKDDNELTNIKQNSDGRWLYVSPLKKYELIINIYEFIFIMIIIINIKNLWKLTGIFKNSIYMSYAVIFWAATGPSINKCGNDPKCYFLLTETEVCLIHRANDCKCNLKIAKNNRNMLSDYYIQYYNYSKIINNKRRDDSVLLLSSNIIRLNFN
ncbi:hypothetical protein BCR36DRAFT_283869, partial [Piromyces finnis]